MVLRIKRRQQRKTFIYHYVEREREIEYESQQSKRQENVKYVVYVI